MRLSPRRLAAACVSLALLGTAPALMTASDAAPPTATPAATPASTPAPTSAPTGAARTYVGDVGPTGTFSLKLTNRPDGRIKVTWKTPIRNRVIKSWKVVTSTSRKMDKHVKTYPVKRTKRALVIRPASLVTPASGDYTFVKLFLVAKKNPRKINSSATRWIKAPVTVVPTVAGRVTVGAFNVRTWNNEAGVSASKKWSGRREHVVSEIKESGAGVVGLQEASGSKSGGYGDDRQWKVIVNALGDGWAVTNDAGYQHGPSNPEIDGLQGTRIIYDTDDYTLIDQGYLDAGKPNPTSTVWVPWARFEQKTTGLRFSMLSAHLTKEADPVRGPYPMSKLRVSQTQKIIAKVDALLAANPAEQVFVVGDMNSTIYTPPANEVHREFVRRGFYDAFASTVVENGQFPTTNSYSFPVGPSPHRRDYILSKGPLKGSFRYVNRVYQQASLTASDHYMQVAELPIGQPPVV